MVYGDHEYLRIINQIWQYFWTDERKFDKSTKQIQILINKPDWVNEEEET